MMEQHKVIQLQHVFKYFKRQHSDKTIGLNDIHLTINAGEIVALIGTNGAGKSTLFNSLTGNISIDSGDILINGQSIKKLSKKQLSQQIGRVFQDPRQGTAPRMTVFENLMLAQKRGESRGFSFSLNQDNYDKMAQLLKTFHLELEKRLEVPMEHLSGGQRQILALIMATLKRPQLLLLDEHTAALDPRTARQVMAMTQKTIRENNLTTLMITHHLQDALTCDRVLVMHQGKICHDFNQEILSQMTSGDLYEVLEALI